MDIGSLSAQAASFVLPQNLTASSSAGKDNDGDNDNGAAEVKSTTAPGVGTAVDITA